MAQDEDGLRVKLDEVTAWLRTADRAVDDLTTKVTRLIEALYGYEAAFGLDQGQRDKLDRMGPADWHMVDIKVRRDGQDVWFQGDWLKDVWYARSKARKVLTQLGSITGSSPSPSLPPTPHDAESQGGGGK